MPDNLQTYKLTTQEQSSSVKFNNLVQAIEDALNSLDNTNIATAAAVAVAKLAAGANDQVLTTVAGVPTWQNAASASVAAGVVAPFAGASAPSGWLLCDGGAVSRTTFAGLFAVIGTTYGAGDGSTTFNVPDLRGRVAVGKGSNAAVDVLGDNEGVSEGNRRPQHRHTAHSHTVTMEGGGSNGANPGRGNTIFAANAATASVDGGSGNVNDSLDAPAFLVLNIIIKT